MRGAGKIAVGSAIGFGIALGVGWLGLQVPPPPLPTYPDGPSRLRTIEIPKGLPAPVERYLRAALGGRLPVTTSAVLSGRGSLRLGPISFPTRLRFTLAAGLGYRHYLECTWFGLPVLRVNEWYLDGQLRQELPFGVVANEPKADQAANIAFWAEQVFWLPSAVVANPRVRWEPIDPATARMVVPFGSEEDRLTVSFDARTSLPQRVEAPRYRAPRDLAKTPWQVEARGWRTFHGISVPSPVALTWLDEGTPWLVAELEDVVYNTDISAYIRGLESH